MSLLAFVLALVGIGAITTSNLMPSNDPEDAGNSGLVLLAGVGLLIVGAVIELISLL